MRNKARGGSKADGCESPTSSARCRGAIARRSALLLGSTAAIALSIAQPASAIVINDQVAAAFGGIANYYDAGNQFPNVVSLFGPGVPGDGSTPPGVPGVTAPGSSCTGSLINSRTILTAPPCFVPAPLGIPSISFAPIAGPGAGITSFVRHPGFVPLVSPAFTIPNDIAVISLAQPVNVTSVAPVKLLTLQPGQPGFPTAGTTITMVGYGLQGTGSSQPAGVWVEIQPGAPPPAEPQQTLDGRRRLTRSPLGLYGVPFYLGGNQPFFVSQFQTNPQNQFPNLPNNNLQAFPATPLEGGTAGGDSGGPVFAVIGGQLVQIGAVRGGRDTLLFYCAGPGGPQNPVVCPDQNNPGVGVTGLVGGNVYGEFSDWTPINLFLQWIN